MLKDYPEAARVIHLHLKEFCDESLDYVNMIAGAARKAGAEIKRLRQAQTNAQQTHGEICSNAVSQSEFICKLDGRECAGNDTNCEDRKLSPC